MTADNYTEIPIQFHSEDIDFQLSEKEQLAEWLEKVIELEGKSLQALTFIFCSDEYLYQLNMEYLQHDTYTDVITFPYSEDINVEGDIFISVERTNENATTFNIPALKELHRVMVHGTLHLCGYHDKTPTEKEQMTQKENEALALLSYNYAD